MFSSETARPIARFPNGAMASLGRLPSPSESPPPRYSSRSSYDVSSSPPATSPTDSHPSSASSWSLRPGDSLAGRPRLRKLMSTEDGQRILVLDLSTGMKFWAVRRGEEFSDSKSTPPRSTAIQSLQHSSPQIHCIPPTPLKHTSLTPRTPEAMSRAQSRQEVRSLVDKRSASRF